MFCRPAYHGDAVFGPCEEGACFALLPANTVSPVITGSPGESDGRFRCKRSGGVFHRLKRKWGKLHGAENHSGKERGDKRSILGWHSLLKPTPDRRNRTMPGHCCGYQPAKLRGAVPSPGGLARARLPVAAYARLVLY